VRVYENCLRLPLWRAPIPLMRSSGRRVEDARGRLIYAPNGGRFLVSKAIDRKPATHANGGTIGFSMSDPKQADAWHKAEVANGGTTIEDPPVVRQGGSYPAYLRDPDGNKLCALYRMPAA